MHLVPLRPGRAACAAVLLLIAWACSDGGRARCGDDDDCPEGYRCGEGELAGECVQFVSVERCRDAFCQLPQERCVAGACRAAARPAADSGAGGGPGPGDAGGGDGGAGGGGVPGPDAGFGGAPGPDAAPPDGPPPRVLIESPVDGASLIETAAVLSGTVHGLSPAGRLSFQVDPAGVRGDLQPTGDRFRVELDLPSGRHTVTVIAEQGPHRVEAAVTVRLDFYVRARNGRLEMRERPFRFVGVNAPSLRELAWHHLQAGGPDRVAALFAKARALGVTVVRTRAYDDRPDAPAAIQTGRGQYNEAGLAALDAVVAAAGEAGVKLLLPLLDGGDMYGGVNQYLRWGGYLFPVPADRRFFYQAGGLREHFKDHVRTVLGRTNTVNGLAYANDPAILGWEVVDGADATGLFDPATAGTPLNEFFADLTQVLKANAPNHLAGTGEHGHDLSPGPYGQAGEALRVAGVAGLLDGSRGLAWQRNVRLASVDFASLQLVPHALGFPADAGQYANLGALWLRSHAAIAATEGKPMIVLQAAMNHRAGLDRDARRAALRAWLDEALSLEIAGILPGNLYPDGAEPGADDSAWFFRDGTQPADPANEYADLVQAAAAEAEGAR